MTEVRLGQKSFRQGQLWRDITAPPVPMGMSLKNQETESLQDSKGKNNREKLAQERFSLDTSNFFSPGGQSGRGTCCSETLRVFKSQPTK